MKNIVITGSTRGLGYNLAIRFLEKGFNVTICGRNFENLNKAFEGLKEYEKQLFVMKCDVQHKDQLESLWKKSIEKWGTIDIWINNAGINQPNKHLWELSINETNSLINTNLLGTIYGCQVAAEGMLKQGSGYIYSMEGFGSNDAFGKGINLYGTSKRALTHFTKSLAKELEGTGVKAGLLSPGMMITDFITGPVGDSGTKDLTERTKKIFNILGDKPETVSKFFIQEILKNTKNNAHIMWLTNTKAMTRFMLAPFAKRNLFD